MRELSPRGESEGYGACDDDATLQRWLLSSWCNSNRGFISKAPTGKGRGFLRLRKIGVYLHQKAKPFDAKGLRSAAAHSLTLARLQTEKCFLPRTRRGKKRLTGFRCCGSETLRGFSSESGKNQGIIAPISW